MCSTILSDGAVQFQVLEVQPNNPKAHFRRGVANLNLNKLEEAERDLKIAQKVNPEGSELYSLL